MGALDPGDLLLPQGPSAPAGAGDEAWIRVRPLGFTRPCWVLAILTSPLDRDDPEAALLAVADHALAPEEDRDLTHFVAVHNLFLERNPVGWGRGIDVDASPVLSLKRLELVRAAVATTRRRNVRDDPLALGWILSHGPTVRYFEPGGMWIVDRSAYLALHERFAATAAAESLLWAAARQPRFDDCEGGSDCWLGRPLESAALYWTRYPDGRWVRDAVGMALEQLRPVVECRRGARFDPPSPGRLDELRATLQAVAGEVKAPLLSLLERMERGCGPGRPERGGPGASRGGPS